MYLMVNPGGAFQASYSSPINHGFLPSDAMSLPCLQGHTENMCVKFCV